MFWILLWQGQREPERTALANHAFDADAAAVSFYRQLAERETQPRTCSIAQIFDLAEFLKDALVIFGSNAGAGIDDVDTDVA